MAEGNGYAAALQSPPGLRNRGDGGWKEATNRRDRRMSMVTLPDIRLKEYDLESLPILKNLRGGLLQCRAHVCIERARHITRYLRDMSSPYEPMEIRYAKAVRYFLSRKEPHFFDDNLLAGTTTSKPFGAPVYPEFTGMTIWPELDVISTRAQNPQILSRKEAEELNFTIFPYWMDRNILEYTRKKYQNPKCMKLFEQLIFFLATKSGCISHTVPNYRVVLEQGVEHIIREAAEQEAALRASGQNITASDRQKAKFYQAVQIALEGVILYAKNLAQKAKGLAALERDPARKEHYLKMAEVCGQVPAQPARTFREAINSVWLVQVAIHAENINMAMSPGRLDQLLYPYYRKDREEGRISLKETLELIGCLWLKLNDNTNLVPETAEELFGGAGTVPAVTVGGVDEQGEDAVNDLTYLMLRVTEFLKLRDPSLNARYHYKKNTREYCLRVAEVISSTKAVPAFHNDVIDIKTLENQGLKTEHARDYAIIGCVELASAGRSYDASSAIMLNLVAPLELALHNGRRPITGNEQIGPVTGDPSQFTSFDQFWEAFTTQLKWLIEEAIKLNECFGKVHQEIMPTPLLSAFFEGPMEKGQDLIFGGALYNSSGATHIGFADTVDSLNAIEKAVFLDRKCTFSELLKALQANFAGHEKLHQYLVNKTPKYGTEDPVALKNSRNMVRFLYDVYQSHTSYRGGKYRPGYWTMTNHAGQGKLAGALPSGRKANKVFASGITPVSQAAQSLAACLKAVAGLDSLCIPSGQALNLKYPALKDKDDLARFAGAVEAYFRHGGMHIQFNIMSYETLLEARRNPDRFPDLLVRVSGYSAYFRDLNEAMKEEIITRTAYDIETGEAVPFPADHSSMLGSA
ncbi:MAG: pyruvate formate lyase family protein [bacterium]